MIKTNIMGDVLLSYNSVVRRDCRSLNCEETMWSEFRRGLPCYIKEGVVPLREKGKVLFYSYGSQGTAERSD